VCNGTNIQPHKVLSSHWVQGRGIINKAEKMVISPAAQQTYTMITPKSQHLRVMENGLHPIEFYGS
jgi:hypothetical protein